MSIKIKLGDIPKQEPINFSLQSIGVDNYNELNNLPKINNITLVGNKTAEDLKLQNKGDYVLKSELPTKTSQLTNDSNFLTEHQDVSHLALKSEVPTKTSQLTNDNNFLTKHQDISGKQDVITDLIKIRNGANLGLSSLQKKDLGNATITITQGGVIKGTFTTNQFSDTVIGLDSGGGIDIDNSTLAGFGYPSSQYINLTLGESGEQYIMPANGWFHISKKSGLDASYCTLYNITTNTLQTIYNRTADEYARILLPVLKGQILQLNYTSTGVVQWFRFYYAQGELDSLIQ